LRWLYWDWFYWDFDWWFLDRNFLKGWLDWFGVLR
jgi:hypothetical protein